MKNSTPVLLGLALALGGCSSSSLFVATETTGGLNVSAANGAPNASLAYQRGELAVIPKNHQGTTDSVYGGLDHDYSLGSDGFAISQTFATGQAAINASRGTSEQGAPGTAQNGTLYFATGTTFGLSLTTNDATTQSPSILAGFRRGEGVYIPMDETKSETNSVYADVSIVYWPKDTSVAADDAAFKTSGQDPKNLPVRKNAVRIRQKFATGEAAIHFVEQGEVKAKLAAAAGNPAYEAHVNAKVGANALRAKLSQITDPAVQKQIATETRDSAGIRDAMKPTDFADLRDRSVFKLTPDEQAELEKIIERNLE
jgi:hypothetical protein